MYKFFRVLRIICKERGEVHFYFMVLELFRAEGRRAGRRTRGFLPSPAHLSLGEAEGCGQLHPLWCRQIALDFKPFLQAGELRVRKHGASFAAAAVLPRQLRMLRVREQRRDRHPYRDKSSALDGTRRPRK